MNKKGIQISYQEVLAVLGIIGILLGWFIANFVQDDEFGRFRCNAIRRDVFILSSRSRQLKSHAESNMIGHNSTDPMAYIEFLSLEIQQIENQIDELQYKLKDSNC